MTRITKTGVCLDPKLYAELGSPGNLGYILYNGHVFLIPATSYLRVTRRNGKPFFSIPARDRDLLIPGTYEGTITTMFGQYVYSIKNGTTIMGARHEYSK